MRALTINEVEEVSGGTFDLWAKSLFGGAGQDWSGFGSYDFDNLVVTGHLDTGRMTTGQLAAWVGVGIALTVVTGGLGGVVVGAIIGGAEVATTSGMLLGAAAAAGAAIAVAAGVVAGATEPPQHVSPGCVQP